MIFYFTGTGNSLYAAQKLADEGEEIISIIDALRRKAFHYVLKEKEKLGFVFPVYFYTVSDPVLEFVRNLKVENAGFVYTVIPCGAQSWKTRHRSLPPSSRRSTGIAATESPGAQPSGKRALPPITPA